MHAPAAFMRRQCASAGGGHACKHPQHQNVCQLWRTRMVPDMWRASCTGMLVGGRAQCRLTDPSQAWGPCMFACSGDSIAELNLRRWSRQNEAKWQPAG